MATFKVNEDFDVDAATLDAAGFNINTKMTEVNFISTMETAAHFYYQNQKIKSLLALYARLITKEADDFKEMAEEARVLDQALVGRFTG